MFRAKVLGCKRVPGSEQLSLEGKFVYMNRKKALVDAAMRQGGLNDEAQGGDGDGPASSGRGA